MTDGKTHKSRIGKGLINMLMFQMYGDEKLIYREYIQNARDAINDAVNHGILGSITDGYISVLIDPHSRQIEIRDNGIGISVDKVEAVLLDIADSTKDGETSAGQFGIGRLVGGYFCRELSFKTSYSGEEYGSEIVFDINKIKQILNDDSNKCEATDVIDIATERLIFEEKREEHYFVVTLKGVDPEYPSLLDDEVIKQYLREVAPVDYSPAFTNQLIQTSIDGQFVELHSKLGYFKISVNKEFIEKPYGLRIIGTGDLINELIYFTLKDDDNYGLLAWGWYALTDFTKAIPISDTNSKFRLRKHNIQVGSSDMLTSLFPKNEQRGNKYFYGEIHIVDPKIKLNSARDGLAPTPQAECLKRLIRDYFDGLVKLYHLANDTKKATERVIDAIESVSNSANRETAIAERQLEEASRKIDSIKKSRNAGSHAAQKIIASYQQRIEQKQKEIKKTRGVISTTTSQSTNVINPHTGGGVSVAPVKENIYTTLNGKYTEEQIKLIKTVFDSYLRNCPIAHRKLIEELQKKAIKELIQ